MATKRPSLGRGLEALLGGSTAASPEAIDSDATLTPRGEEEFARIPVDLLQRGRYQPRLDMRPEARAQAIVDGRS